MSVNTIIVVYMNFKYTPKRKTKTNKLKELAEIIKVTDNSGIRRRTKMNDEFKKRLNTR